MKTRNIGYIDPNEDPLDIEVDIALKSIMAERFRAFCEMIAANYAMIQIDVVNYPVKREIYYIEDGE